jgi:hypothetical protein
MTIALRAQIPFGVSIGSSGRAGTTAIVLIKKFGAISLLTVCRKTADTMVSVGSAYNSPTHRIAA